MTDKREVSRETVYRGERITVHRAVFQDGDQTTTREIVDHPDAVAVVAVDEDHRVLLLRHYREPLGEELWELPAGLCDHDDETPQQTAARELAEEAGLRADQWQPLVRLHPSPGFTGEQATIYLARGLESVNADADTEEAISALRWVSLDEAIGWVFREDITNGLAVAGLLAARHQVPAERAEAL